MAAVDNLLVAEKVRKEFGGLVATDDVDFTIPRGSIVALIGPNGAGKTTFFNQITGVYEPTSGSIVFDGTEVVGKPPHAIVELGIGRTFQNIRLFAQMTALENVLVGMHCRLRGGIFGSILRTPRVKREEVEAREKARSERIRIDTDLAGYESQMKTTKFFFAPAEAVSFTTSADLVATMQRVATFSFDHGILGEGAKSAEFVGVSFPNGKTFGDTANQKLRFSETYMKLAADGKL